MYDETNIFAKILKKEIPCRVIYEDDYGLAFHDIHPKASIHALVIPKGPYSNFDEFIRYASPEVIVGYYTTIEQVIEKLGVRDKGYRLIVNVGVNGGQEVPHLHTHILAGEVIGPMTCKPQDA